MISAYLDELVTIEEIVHAANELSIKRIPLRNVENQNIYFISDEKIKEIDKTLKLNKIRVELIDIDKEYDLYDYFDMRKIASICKTLGCKTVLLKLPVLTNFDAEKEQLVIFLNNLLQEFKKEKLELLFHVNYIINSGYIAYLIKNIKDLYFSYNPAECYFNDKSITTYYRLIRSRIKSISLYDLDENKKPVLIGYGKALVLDIIDSLNRDKYKGNIYYDSNLGEYVKAKKQKQEAGFFKRLFSIKKRKSHQNIDEKLRLEDNEEIDFINLLKGQLKIISKYQKI